MTFSEKVSFRFTPALLFLLILSACGKFTFNEASLTAAVNEVRPAVEKATGRPLAKKIAVRFGSRETFAKVLREDFKPIIALQFEDPETAKAVLEYSARLYSHSLLAKYDFRSRTILVSAENIEQTARRLGIPSLTSRTGLEVILAHEFVHASDDLQFGYPKQIPSLTTYEATRAFDAVLEGHAQFVARGVCQTLGLETEFETFTASIGKPPVLETQEEGLAMISRALSVASAGSYHDGELFIAALFAGGGERAVKRAFQNPPTEMEIIFHPGWFLNPSSRSQSPVDFKACFTAVEGAFDSEIWKAQRSTASRAQIEESLSLVQTKERNMILNGMRFNRCLVITPRKGPIDRMAIVGLFIFDSPAGAGLYVAASESMGRAKDRKLAGGSVRVVAAVYEMARGERWQGLYWDKQVDTFGQTVHVSGLVGHRGTTVVEINFSGMEADKEILGAFMDVILYPLSS